MNQFHTHSGVAPHAWLQHHLPWLGLFALVLSLICDDADLIGFDPDDRNG